MAFGSTLPAVERRHAELQHSAGLNEEVFDPLIVLAAGAWQPDAIRSGYACERRVVPERPAGLGVYGMPRASTAPV